MVVCTVKHPCRLKPRPSAGAIIQYANGIADFNLNTVSPGYRIAGCPFNIPRLNKEDNRYGKCTPASIAWPSVGYVNRLRQNFPVLDRLV